MIMANSWGAELAHQVSEAYFRKCGAPTDLFVMIDGIQKPWIFAFSKLITATNCVNYFQSTDLVRGGPIPTCSNYDLSKSETKVPKRAHVWAEWVGSRLGSESIKQFLGSPR